MAPARPDFLILGLAAAGFAIAAYLTWLKWMGGNAAFCLSGQRVRHRAGEPLRHASSGCRPRSGAC